MHIHELNNPIFVNTPLGMGKAIILIDYGTEINSVWKVVLHNSGMVRNFYDTDIIVLPNKMDGGSIDENYFKNKKNKK
jgi:hypothetical protein